MSSMFGALLVIFGAAETLEIPCLGDTFIVEEAYIGLTGYDSVTIAEGFAVIGGSAFKGAQITSVTLPSTLTEIRTYAFSESKLTSISFPEGTQVLATSCFNACRDLMSISIPASVTTIESLVFVYTPPTAQFTIATDNPKFKHTNNMILEKVGSNWKIIHASDSFVNMELDSSSITIIGHSSCSRLTNLVTVKCVHITKLEPYAIAYCPNLKSITFGAAFVEISDLSLQDCIRLDAVSIEGTNTRYEAVDGILYKKSNNDLATHFVPAGKDMSVFVIPFGMKTITGGSFGESNVAEFQLEEGTTEHPSLRIYNGVVYSADYKKLILCPRYIDATKFDWHPSLTAIGDQAFYSQRSLTTINIPEGVVSIGYQAFTRARSVTTMTFPDSLERFSNNCFHEVQASSLVIPRKVTVLNQFMCAWMGRLTTVRIDGNLEIMKSVCFSNCANLRSINFPRSLQRIESKAFFECDSLLVPVLPEGLQYIGESVFEGCIGIIGQVDIPSSVHTIDTKAFYMCSGITLANVINCNTHIGDLAFYATNGTIQTVCVMTRVFTDIVERDPALDFANLLMATFATFYFMP